MSERDGFQGPTNGDTASEIHEFLYIVSHPAFRLGVLDVQRARPFDHDRIDQRITSETPASALNRLNWDRDLFRNTISLSQYRYEEGRILATMFPLRIRSWNHPDYAPKAIIDLCFQLAGRKLPPPARGEAP